MKKIYLLALVLTPALNFAQKNVGTTGNVDGVYINELHYDNSGTDVGEFIEVAGPAGTDLTNYTITLYNGSNNASYATITLTGTIDDEGAGVGAVSFDYSGIQNGAPDAIALSKTGSTDVQYLSYEGVMSATATNGPAIGLNSEDILVAEGTNVAGTSLEYDENAKNWVVIADDTPGVFAQGTVLSLAKNEINGLKIYPNPVTNGAFNVVTESLNFKTIEIFDTLGKEVMNAQITDENVNVSSLNKGVYFVKISEEGKTSTRKLVIN